MSKSRQTLRTQSSTAGLFIPCRFGRTICRLIALLFVLACVLPGASADTFTYDSAGRLQSASQANGLAHSYSYDEENNLLSASHSGTDTTDTGGAGNGIPDWWEYYYFGIRGINPLASPAGDGISNLMKFALGLNPLIPVSVSQSVSLSLQTYTDGKTYPYLTFIRAHEAASLLNLQQSVNLVTWQSGNVYFIQMGSVQDLGNGNESVLMRSLTPFSNASPRMFFRLEAPVP